MDGDNEQQEPERQEQEQGRRVLRGHGAVRKRTRELGGAQHPQIKGHTSSIAMYSCLSKTRSLKTAHGNSIAQFTATPEPQQIKPTLGTKPQTPSSRYYINTNYHPVLKRTTLLQHPIGDSPVHQRPHQGMAQLSSAGLLAVTLLLLAAAAAVSGQPSPQYTLWHCGTTASSTSRRRGPSRSRLPPAAEPCSTQMPISPVSATIWAPAKPRRN